MHTGVVVCSLEQIKFLQLKSGSINSQKLSYSYNTVLCYKDMVSFLIVGAYWAKIKSFSNYGLQTLTFTKLMILSLNNLNSDLNKNKALTRASLFRLKSL